MTRLRPAACWMVPAVLLLCMALSQPYPIRIELGKKIQALKEEESGLIKDGEGAINPNALPVRQAEPVLARRDNWLSCSRKGTKNLPATEHVHLVVEHGCNSHQARRGRERDTH